MVDDSNRFFKSNTVCAVRYANFTGELLQKRRFHPTLLERAARRAGAAEGNDLGQPEGRLVQIRAIVTCAGKRER
jgi:hypothetical protein